MSLYNPNPVIVHCGLLKKRTGYHIFIWGEQKKHKKYIDIEPFKYPFIYSPFELKLSLFRSHQASFYGTFLSTEECYIQVPLDQRLFYSEAGSVPVYHVPASHTTHTFPIEGIKIPLSELPLYLNELIFLETNNEWRLADDFVYFQQLIKKHLLSISEGDFLPSTSHGMWELINFPLQTWEDAAPTSFLSLFYSNQWINENEEDRPSVQSFSTAFTNEYLLSLLQQDDSVKTSFNKLKQNKVKPIKDLLEQFSSHDQKIIDNGQLQQQFLQEVGAVKTTPFVLGIKVEEPEGTSEDWNLTLFIQDRKDPSLIIDVDDLLNGKHPWRENPITFIKQELQRGQNQIEQLKQFSLTASTITVTIDEAYEFLFNHKDQLTALGFVVLVPTWWNKKIDQFSVTLKQNQQTERTTAIDPLLNWNNIAQFDFSVAVDGIVVTEKEFQELVNLKQSMVKLRGKWVVWDINTAEQLQEKIATFKDNKKLTYMDAYQLQQKDDVDEKIHWNAKWNVAIENLLKDLAQHSWNKIEVPNQLKGTLRPYQHDGFSWLVNMRKIGFGACLADDMGLGKTIQTIAYILAVIEGQQTEQTQPVLLICPTSLIGNWQHEFSTFAPNLNIYVHHGSTRQQEEELNSNMLKYDVIITSYALAVRDESLWTSTTWNGLILDEAQHIKNIETKQRRAIKEIDSVHRIALTGTPIENRLKELWSIVDLLNDHFLGSFSQFQTTYIKEIEGQEQNTEKLDELKKIISLFLLRRTKQDKNIHLQLPEKQEIVHQVGLTIEQASLYQAVINDLFDRVDTVSEMERRALILSSLTKLKQICNHPAHYLKDGSRLTERSQKWEKMMDLTDSFIQNKEKGLIFTQYKQMGLLIQQGLEEKYRTPIPFLHGSLQRHKREELIQEFINGEAPVFILSLKAGGVGLNLTAANHVIHYDRWWNPAVENQATDRAYRIGQLQDVTVHKIVTKGTLEEKIHAMLERKQKLSDQILNTNENKLSELTTNELENFLKLRTSIF